MNLKPTSNQTLFVKFNKNLSKGLAGAFFHYTERNSTINKPK